MDTTDHSDAPRPVNSDLERIAVAAERLADDFSHFRNLLDGALGSETAEVLFRRLGFLAKAAFAFGTPTDYNGLAGLLNYGSEEGAKKAAADADRLWVGKRRLQRPVDVLSSRGVAPE